MPKQLSTLLILFTIVNLLGGCAARMIVCPKCNGAGGFGYNKNGGLMCAICEGKGLVEAGYELKRQKKLNETNLH